ncbi:MAG: type II secretion system protein GspD, partial [Sphingomonadales bacterium]
SGLVIIEFAQEVSDVVGTTTSGIDSPTIQQRKIESTVAVHDGETIALGGLIRESESRGNSGVPFLKNIPLLGAAFRSANRARRRTELLVFMTPHVIRSLQDARDTTDYLRGQLRDMNLDGMLEQ